jgi:hypothetical protein
LSEVCRGAWAFDGHIPAVGTADAVGASVDEPFCEDFEVTRVFGEFLCECAGGVADAFAVVIEGEFAFEFGKDRDASADFGGRDLIGHESGGSAIAAAEGEDVNLHEARLAAGIEGFLEFRFGFAGEADDDIGAEGGGGAKDIADLFETVEETLDAVATAHAREY